MTIETQFEILQRLVRDKVVPITPDNLIATAELVREGYAVCNQGLDSEIFLMLPGNKWD